MIKNIYKYIYIYTKRGTYHKSEFSTTRSMVPHRQQLVVQVVSHRSPVQLSDALIVKRR